MLFVAAWILLSLLLGMAGKTDTSYLDVVQFFLSYASQQPWIVAVPVAVIVASILTTRGAFRQKAWAHWAAMALVAISTVPFIAVAVAFRDWSWWLLALPYCAACVAFLAAMTYAFAKYGPWGAIRSQADPLALSPTL